MLSGPVGTGKTELATLIPKVFWKKVGGYHAEVYTANSDWSTHDVIDGIMPLIEKNEITYGFHYGCALETISKNWEKGIGGGSRTKFNFHGDEFNGVWLVIDEFNRADIDKAFGHLFTALRTRWIKIPTNNKNESYVDVKIPKDFRIICTLNTSDKHFLFKLSDVLKSRFAFIKIDTPKKHNKGDEDKEIYYAMKNAAESIEIENPKLESLIFLDHGSKRVYEEKSNKAFYTGYTKPIIHFNSYDCLKSWELLFCS